MSRAAQDAAAATERPPPSVPQNPPISAHSDSEPADEPQSPPRKRPRTHAPSRPAPPAAPTVQAPVPEAVTVPTPPSQIYRFPIQPLNRFQGASASIKRPREVAHFSYDDNHDYRDDDSSISYYCPPQIGADLKEGFDTFRRFEEQTDAHIDSLLRALITKERKAKAKEKADFVTWRGMMTKIMTAPFDNFAEFSMFATLHDGTIYIEEDFPSRAAQRAAEANRPPPRWQDPKQSSHEMMTYWGYKFETLALLSTPPADTPKEVMQSRPKAPVSNHAQHCSIITTSIGPHTLLLGGEVDGLASPKPSSPDQPIPWIELKTAEELPPNPAHRDILKFERKLLKFWAQSFLLGVPKIIVGWRSKRGILTGLQEIEMGKVPGMVRRGTGCWDGNVCINFAASFLAHLKDVVSEEGVYRIELRKKAGVVEIQKVKEGYGDVVSKEFVAWREELQKESEGEKQHASADQVV